MKVMCELNDYSKPSKPRIKILSCWNDSKIVIVEINGEQFTVSGGEMIEAVKNAMNKYR